MHPEPMRSMRPDGHTSGMEDREKSIAAGASDYIAKPIDVEQLLSLMRVWLHQ